MTFSSARPIKDMGQKELETLMGTVEMELAGLNTRRKQRQAFYAEIQAEITRRKEDKNFKPGFSDHALLRYMERAMGFDVEGLRAKLLTPELVSAMKVGATQYLVDGIAYRLRDNTVITIIDRSAA